MRAVKRVCGAVLAAAMTLGMAPATAQAQGPVPIAGVQPARPSDPLLSAQWSLVGPHGIHPGAAWTRTDGEGVTVAVVDSGITSHPELAGRILPGYDFISDARLARDGNGRDPDPSDRGDWRHRGQCGMTAAPSSWHGTHVAGLIAAAGNNRKGISGVAPGARLVPVRAVGPCGGDEDDVADAITWASGGRVRGVPPNANPARIVNLSLAVRGMSCPAPIQKAVSGAVARGALVLGAAGNDSVPTQLSVPANCRGVVVVTGTDERGLASSFANRGAQVQFAAPAGSLGGDGLLSLWNAGDRSPGEAGYATISGTSQATALAAGTAALVWSARPGLSAGQVVTAMSRSARPVRNCSGCGAGRIDASAAVALATRTGSPAVKDIYSTPGYHVVNGRRWRTLCEPYSRTKRCRTEIWASQVRQESRRFVVRTGWVFNNLTYLPSPRRLWRTNPLGRTGSWTQQGRSWRTECDTAVTGRNGCRSYILGDVVRPYRSGGVTKYRWTKVWVFNNMVRFG